MLLRSLEVEKVFHTAAKIDRMTYFSRYPPPINCLLSGKSVYLYQNERSENRLPGRISENFRTDASRGR